MDALREADAVTDDVTTLAYSYIGPELTHAVYKNGSIGKAKDHLQQTSDNLQQQLEAGGGKSFISVNKAVVTQASSAIPVVPLYMSILFKVMKEKGTHEGCIEQMYRLFKDFLYNPDGTKVDDKGRIRLDDLEMQPDVQQKIVEVWGQVSSDNLNDLTDIASYRHYFHELFGFELEGIDYDADVDVNIGIESIE